MDPSPSTVFGKLKRLRVSEYLDLFPALWALLAARVVVWTRPIGSLVAPRTEQNGPAVVAGDEALRWSRAIHRAAAYGPYRAKCLVRSIALKRMLDAHGVRGARVCVGVRQSGGKFMAHAWVDLAGRVLGDEEAGVRAFEQLSDVHLVDPR